MQVFAITILLAMQSLRSKLLAGGKSYGPIVLSGSPTVAELLAFVGYDHIVLDMEHSPANEETIQAMLRAVDSAARGRHPVDNFPIVRVPSHDDVAVTKRVLDILRTPGGIMFPMIENAEQAEAAVASTRYPPFYKNGIRGCAHPFVRASSFGKNKEYFEKDSHQELLTILQVESSDAIEKIPEIGMVDGVDMIFLGPFDISCSINKMGQFEEEGEVMKLLERAESLVRETSERKKIETGTSLCLAGFRAPNRSLKKMFSDEVGYNLVCGAADVGMISTAAMNDYEAGRDAKA